MPFFQLGSARLSSARLSSAQLGSALLSSDQLGSARLSSKLFEVLVKYYDFTFLKS